MSYSILGSFGLRKKGGGQCVNETSKETGRRQEQNGSMQDSKRDRKKYKAASKKYSKSGPQERMRRI